MSCVTCRALSGSSTMRSLSTTVADAGAARVHQRRRRRSPEFLGDVADAEHRDRRPGCCSPAARSRSARRCGSPAAWLRDGRARAADSAARTPGSFETVVRATPVSVLRDGDGDARQHGAALVAGGAADRGGGLGPGGRAAEVQCQYDSRKATQKTIHVGSSSPSEVLASIRVTSAFQVANGQTDRSAASRRGVYRQLNIECKRLLHRRFSRSDDFACAGRARE